MIEQPRLAALGIAMMLFGVLWIGVSYRLGSDADSEKSSSLDDTTDSDHAPEPAAETPSETDASETDTETTATPTEADPAAEGRSVGADDVPVDTESLAATDDCGPPDTSASASDTNL
ncbi:hypothetical protein QA600_20670 [Natronococcus sp. A-GB1]|uniref:hypothetical protein n=1 Tax=Natronococcus sp. A-GB1 TaxID=3037648 RepID=UPI00241EE09A|nr:hypothetical protein [Natronococcus sp. A-GB1]MDG5761739.1 hypothetical protein [Natronococcus sp. A-GB1]